MLCNQKNKIMECTDVKVLAAKLIITFFLIWSTLKFYTILPKSLKNKTLKMKCYRF